MAAGRRIIPYRYYNATLGLILANAAVFMLEFLRPALVIELALIPPAAIEGRWWTLLTYMFLHSRGSLYHIIFNMLGLMWFGSPVERHVGSTEFIALYVVSGIGAGLFALMLSANTAVAIIGASGAVFAVMLAFATLYPDSEVYLFWFLPLRAPVAVLVFAGIAVLGTLTGFQPGISHLTHLGGLIAGFLYVWLRLGRNPIDAFFRR